MGGGAHVTWAGTTAGVVGGAEGRAAVAAMAERLAIEAALTSPDAATYDELLASDAARLKAEIRKVADECYQQLLRDTFRL